MSNELLKRIQCDLRNFPEEIIIDWLLPFAIDIGWSQEAFQKKSRWKNILTHSVELWSTARWTLEKLNIDELSWTQRAQNCFLGMNDAYLCNKINSYTSLKDSDGKERFRKSLFYLLQHGIFPKPIILLRYDDGYEVMDGNHRLLALFVAQKLTREISTNPDKKVQLFKLFEENDLSICEIVIISDIQKVWVARFPNRISSQDNSISKIASDYFQNLL
ncbi:MAG: hypothetical protein WC730_00525 [Patescibacteria group bacterium]